MRLALLAWRAAAAAYLLALHCAAAGDGVGGAGAHVERPAARGVGRRHAVLGERQRLVHAGQAGQVLVVLVVVVVLLLLLVVLLVLMVQVGVVDVAVQVVAMDTEGAGPQHHPLDGAPAAVLGADAAVLSVRLPGKERERGIRYKYTCIYIYI